MVNLDPGQMPQHLLHRFLLSAVAPRPIALASTMDLQGRANLSPFSCFNVFGVNPTTLIFSPSRSGRANHLKDTCLNVQEVPEVVINVVTSAMVQQTNLASKEFDRGVNEFYQSGLTPVPSDLVKPFRVKESPIQLECKVRQVIETGHGPGAANLVICEVLLIHADERMLDDQGMPDTQKLQLVGRMGADYYVEAFGPALFELPKPADYTPIGVSALPESVRLSEVLTGNDLGRLGSLPWMPGVPEIESYRKTVEYQEMIAVSGEDTKDLSHVCHQKAAALIKQNQVAKALLCLMAGLRQSD